MIWVGTMIHRLKINCIISLPILIKGINKTVLSVETNQEQEEQEEIEEAEIEERK